MWGFFRILLLKFVALALFAALHAASGGLSCSPQDDCFGVSSLAQRERDV